jgi:hypothetical protein
MAHLFCQVHVDPSAKQAAFTWSEGPASFQPYQITGTRFMLFQKLAKEARERLTDLVKEYLNAGREGGHPTTDPCVRKSCFRLAETGHKLYQQVFAPDGAREVQEWLEELRDQGQVESLELVLDGPRFVAWNVLYDREPDEACFLRGEDAGHWLLMEKLEQGGREAARAGGLAFLNACQTGHESDTEGSFVDTFHELRFSGLVATEELTIDTFANLFGLDFLRAVLAEGQEVGAALHRLRRQNVPLSLLYTTYCPPHLRLGKGGDAQAPADQTLVRELNLIGRQSLKGKEGAAPGSLLPLPDHPYRSLNYYRREHRALFAGRDGDVERFAVLV